MKVRKIKTSKMEGRRSLFDFDHTALAKTRHYVDRLRDDNCAHMLEHMRIHCFSLFVAFGAWENYYYILTHNHLLKMLVNEFASEITQNLAH